MTNYRCSDIAGASYFFTVNLADRSQSLLTDNIALLRSAFEYTRERHPFSIDAVVICRITFTQSGRCQKAITISRCAGG
ncbi:hypothetical protein FGKAn22_01690 [Ferrigenium kumadai]|uniref:Uncharacterized protein n=1 Tax=Ferrigenium kumadai TaxID=1682490 RepID=A0AAN1SXN1_9PROT|nr:hypothetical protein [Ferrigenium kumadai]BBI98476.1 hypothetical protein FGKAn22_01690 [Ferrigenium kumadai]